MNLGMDAELKSKMCIEHDFVGCRYNNSIFDFHNWHFKINLAAFRQEDEDEAAKLMAIAFQKIKFFMECFINDVFIISNKDLHVVEGFAIMNLDNNVILLPDATSDDILVQALHSKLSCLTKDVLYIGEVSLRCEQTKSSFHYNSFDGSYDLPKQDGFMGEHALYEEPWWSRHDCDTFDTMIGDDVDRDSVIKEVDTSRLLYDLEKNILNEMEGNSGKPRETKIIKMAEASEIWKTQDK